MSSDYEVGYGKPPKHSRFKKGESGNPKGRPKKSKNLKSLLTGELTAPTAILEDGKRQTVSRVEAIVKAYVSKALKGRPADVQRLLVFALELGALQLDEPKHDVLGEDDQAVLTSFLESLRTRTHEEGGNHDNE